MEIPASHERLRQVQRLFAEVVGLDTARREARLERACQDDPHLREEVQVLLDRYGAGESLKPGPPHEPRPNSPPSSQPVSRGEPPTGSRVGERIGRYRLEEELGRGAMGVVYRAEDMRLGRHVALKFLSSALSADMQACARLDREARAVSALDHPNICTLYEIGEADDGRLYLALACYDGETLAERLERGPLAPDDAAQIAAQMARGLTEAHRHGIVHRDVKPSNVFVTDDGVVKLLDFGIAHMMDSELTRAGDTLGTAAYMSPEHLQGTVDTQADVWALGVVLYEMVAGTRPFQGDYEAALFYAILHAEPEPISERCPDVPVWLAAVITRCLEKEPQDRFDSAAAVEAALKPSLDGDRYSAPLALPSQRRTLVIVALALLGLLIPGAFPSVRTATLGWLGIGAVPDEKRIAVLPFSVAGSDPSTEAFSDGLTEILASTLTQLEQFEGALWVVPTSEVRGRGITSAEEARQAFGVNLVVTGSVQRDAARVRSTLNLVDAVSLRQLRSEVNDVPVSELNALQNEIVGDLEDMLDLELEPEPRRVLVASYTADPAAYDDYLQALGYLQRYERAASLDTAIRLLERALEEDPGYALAQAGLAEAYWRKYELTKDVQWVEPAEAHSQHALDLNDQLAPVHVTLGLIYTGTGRPAEAVGTFERALALNPTDAAAYRGLAKAYEAQGRLDEAEATYRRAIELRPDYWGSYNVLGVFYSNHGRLDEAVEPFKRVIELTPDNTRGYINLGAVYFYLQRPDEAIAMFERSIQAEPTYDAYTNLATLYYYQQRYTEAARIYEEALAINDEDYRVWGNLGSAYYWTLSERDKAEGAYQNAIRRAEEEGEALGTTEPITLASLAGYYAQTGDDAWADSLIEQALADAPDDSDVAFQAAFVYEHLGERVEALRWVRRALEADHPQVEIESEPGLENLRADPRYHVLVDEVERSSAQQG